MGDNTDHLRAISTESERFRAVLQRADPAAEVPTCPGWTASDLVWHLTEVQDFWRRVVQQRCADPGELQGPDLERPGDHGELLRLAGRAGKDLVKTLKATPPATPVWTWAEDQTAGFVRRRQAHEALIHRVDAECTTGQRTPLDPALSADGVDEVLRVMFHGAPDWAELTTDEHASVQLRTTDTGHSWHAVIGTFSGTDPDGGHHQEERTLVVVPDRGLPVAGSVSAAAGDLDCWLWGRPPLGGVELGGDVKVLAALRAVVDTGIQ